MKKIGPVHVNPAHVVMIGPVFQNRQTAPVGTPWAFEIQLTGHKHTAAFDDQEVAKRTRSELIEAVDAFNGAPRG